METQQSSQVITTLYRRRIEELHKYVSLEERIKTFEDTDYIYPHQSKKLNPTTLAKAGFVRGSVIFPEANDLLNYIPLTIRIESDEDDTVFCPFCFKHLSEFEPDDQPFQEHKDHKANCVFINQVATVRSRTSLWMDPLSMKPAKGKQIISVGDLQDMHNTIGKAHWEYIEHYQKTLLEEESARSSQMWLLNSIKRRKKSGNKAWLKAAFQGEQATAKLSAPQSIVETPRIDPRSVPKPSPLMNANRQKLATVYKVGTDKYQHNLKAGVGGSTASDKRRAPLRGVSANFEDFKNFSPANAVFPKHSVMSGKENSLRSKGVTPMRTPMAPKSADNTSGLHNQTISMGANELPKNSATVANELCMSPGTPVVGGTKTMYIPQPNGRSIPVQVSVDRGNVQELKRLSKGVNMH